MSDWLAEFFHTHDFPARWQCGLWTPFHGWLHIVSDLGIWLAYTAIPIIIIYFMRKRRDLVFPRVGWLFAAFIFFCGTGHLIEASIFWWPNYRLSGAIKLCTVIASWGTVAAIIPIVPKALELPGLQDVINRLQVSMRGQEATQAALTDRNRELETILQIISHDLREPIRGIRGLVSIYREQKRGSTGEEDELLRRIEANGTRLDAIVRNLGEYSRVRKADLTRKDEVDLASVVGEARERLEERISLSHAHLTIETPLPVVKINREWVTAAIYNLISNALRYTGKESAPDIHIAAYRDAGSGEVGLAVHDRGPGVPDAMKERIFELFRQGVNRDPEGTGAGLAIVREVAMRHEGRAWVQDREGGGASFFLTFGEGTVA